MGRRSQILKHVRKQQRGIEIGPWFDPLAPKHEGYDVLVLDVFGTAELLRRAEADPAIPKEKLACIESVDLIGSAHDIADTVATQAPPLGSFDYVISSHNFEHVPNPIHFLQGCQQVLRPGRMLSFAVPDRRVSFDYFNPHSITADFLEAFFASRTRPTPKQVFRTHSLHARFDCSDGSQSRGFLLTDDTQHVRGMQLLEDAYQAWVDFENNPDDLYRDTHCWVFTPASLELILRDLRYLGLMKFDVLEVSPTRAHEFYVHLRNVAAPQPIPRSEFYELRNRLLHRIHDEASVNAPSVFARPRTIWSTFRLARVTELLCHVARSVLSIARRPNGLFSLRWRRDAAALDVRQRRSMESCRK